MRLMKAMFQRCTCSLCMDANNLHGYGNFKIFHCFQMHHKSDDLSTVSIMFLTILTVLILHFYKHQLKQFEKLFKTFVFVFKIWWWKNSSFFLPLQEAMLHLMPMVCQISRKWYFWLKPPIMKINWAVPKVACISFSTWLC